MVDERRRLQLQKASRKYYSTHKDLLKEQRRLYYRAHRDTILRRAREKSRLLQQLYQASSGMRAHVTND